MDLNRFFSTYQSLFEQPVMTLATTNLKCEAHAAAVYFAAVWNVPENNSKIPNLQMFFFSHPTSRHSCHLQKNSHAGAEIHPQVEYWKNIHGLQMHGDVKELTPGQSWDRAWQAYAEKFSFVNGLGALLSQNTFYCFTTGWLRLIDNRLGFGFKAEWHFS